MMRADDNNHNYDKSTINVLGQKIFSVTPKSLVQERERKNCSYSPDVQAFEASHVSRVQNSIGAGVRLKSSTFFLCFKNKSFYINTCFN